LDFQVLEKDFSTTVYFWSFFICFSKW
jgi:hypothetical protein